MTAAPGQEIDSLPAVVLTSADGLHTVTLVSPSDGTDSLVSASIRISNSDPTDAGGRLMAMFMIAVVPAEQFDAATAWVSAQLEAGTVTASGREEVSLGTMRLILEMDGASLTLTVEVVP